MTRRLARIDALEAQHARVEGVHISPADDSPEAIGDLLMALLAAKLRASRAVAEGAAALMHSPGWLAQQPAEGLAQLGEYLDGSAMALGDRLASRGGNDAPIR